MNTYFAIAAITSLAVFFLHIFVGGKFVARAILKSEELHQVAKYTSYYCWHLVTISIGAIALAFAIAAQPGGSQDLAIFATAMSALFSLWSIVMITIHKLPAKHFPQYLLFLPSAVLGTIGLLT